MGAKIPLLIVLTVAVCFAFSSVYLIHRQKQELGAVLVRNGHSIADMLAYSNIDAVLSNDIPVMNTTLVNAREKNPDIAFVQIAKDGQVLASVGSVPDDTSGYLFMSSPITVEGDTLPSRWNVGEVTLWLSKNTIDATLESMRWRLAGTLLLCSMAIALLLAFVMRRAVTKPISELEKHANKWGRGDFQHRIQVSRNDEIGKLESAFNSMLDNLENTMVTKEFVSGILMSTSEVIVVTDIGGKVEWINKAAEDFFSNKSQFSFVHDTFVFKNLETEFTREDGLKVPFLFSRSLVKTADGQSKSFVYVGRDISERKQAESQIAEQQAQLMNSAKMSALGEMAGGLAHEINTPLTVLSLQTQVIKKWFTQPTTDPDLLKRLDVAVFSIKRISTIVNSLRTFSRDTSRDGREIVPLKKILDETMILCTERFKNHHVDLTIGAYDPEINLYCRATDISQVLLNILNNAFDAVRKQAEPWVHIEFHRAGEELEISITDSGRAIPQSIVEKMMLPFFTTKGPGEGTGLGLSIAKGIVESHQGRLEYDSESPNTRFKIVLPFGA